MSQSIVVSATHLQTLDLAVAHTVLSQVDWHQTDLKLRFEIDYPRDANDPRELSEVPEVRLWFLRLDSHYPWLPLFLEVESGDLGRYAAMLVPHQFSPLDGIRYNPEALEIFVMGKVFTIAQWLKDKQIDGIEKLKLMVRTLGYELDNSLFELLS
ncbi:CRR6 family NdhI maturation factor [Leptothoe sp. PORK10 BA2]|uniref:CRR6 family NdhI maturation factor n=1 Tax=Leptothoe sp. PORK10 BA2 TaxID=3110254 RepID=UPI002B1FB8AF|nr:CRR6 family NdhI maturation factor [Leptothoe sp. PORK10 BA2]MEA5463478.1 CRR6 family NdhI maturation factor [Leptothoe sp. PORK10 BA2]